MPLNQPASLRVKTGSYTGNGAAARQITTGFKCALVIIQRTARTWIITNLEANHHLNSGSYHYDRSSDVSLHATNGFVVGDAGGSDNFANANATLYDYFAISI